METILVLGGGAGGLELVVRLARKLRRQSDVRVLLVDRNPTHIWKPLLHEVATGSLNSHHDELSYRVLARKHGFEFILGNVSHIDGEARQVSLSAEHDGDEEWLPTRTLGYDTLVLALGSLSNDFGTAGVAEHCVLLDSRQEAERFHDQFIRLLRRTGAPGNNRECLSVVIVGAGATGVELAADLHNVAAQLPEYGFGDFSADRLAVRVVEAGDRVLAQLPERISVSVKQALTDIGVEVMTGTAVSEVFEASVRTSGGEVLASDITVWAAGIRAPRLLANSGMPVDRLGRVTVDNLLEVAGLPGVFALGDCCACPMADGSVVPPRAQSANQMAKTLAGNLLRGRRGKAPRPFVYKDLGSLVSLSEFSTIGNLMGNLMRGTVFIEGWLARMFYLSLYRMHQATVLGLRSTILIMIGDRIYKATRAELKLH